MITVRPADAADIVWIVALNAFLFREDAGTRDASMDLEWSEKHGFTYFTDVHSRSNYCLLVAENVGSIVGYLAGYVSPPNEYHTVTSATLESIYVLDGFRDQSVGRRMTEQFVEWSKQQGAVRMTVTAYYANALAIEFYERLGFAPFELILELKMNELA